MDNISQPMYMIYSQIIKNVSFVNFEMLVSYSELRLICSSFKQLEGLSGDFSRN